MTTAPRASLWLPLLVAAPLALPLGGCRSGNNVTQEALRLENEELRDVNQRLEDALASCSGELDGLTAERDAIAAENARLRAENAAQAVPAADTTGFANMGSGVEVSTRGGEIVVEIAGDVLFDSGKATLKSDAQRTLDRVARVIRDRYPSNVIRVAGHTDSDPIRKSAWKTNERLSAERALAVEAYLASKGIDGDRMYAAAYGSADPKSSKRASRRVEIVILAPGAT